MSGLINKNNNFQVIAMRAIVVNSKNQLLIVSEDSIKWHLPGGWIETLEDPLLACNREIHEETGMIVEGRKIIYVSEYIQKPSEQFNNYVQKIDLYCVCDIIENENLNDDWKDPDNELIKYKKFITNDEWKTNKNITSPLELKKLNIIDIKNMPNCYSKII